MKNSENSPTTLKNDQLQLPLRGFKVEVESPNPNFRKYIEHTLDGRIRMHMVKKPLK